MNPLISLNSCVILPPLDSTSFFACAKSSGDASGLRVTCMKSAHFLPLSRSTYVVLSRHFGRVYVKS